MNIFDLEVKTVCVGPNRNLWECALSWDDVALLIANPVCFVHSTLGRRLNDLAINPIVVVQFSYPGPLQYEQDAPGQRGDVIAQGIDDTSVIKVTVKRPFPNPAGLPDLQLDTTMKVQVVLRLKDQLATAHFHLKGDNQAVKRETYTLVRHPAAYARAINNLPRHLVEVIVIDRDERPEDCEQGDERKAEVPGQAQMSATANPVTFSTDPTVRLLSVEYNSATDDTAGCHSADGTISGQPGPSTIFGSTVNCVTYSPTPTPVPTPSSMPSGSM